MQKITLILFSLLLTIASCKKDKIETPTIKKGDLNVLVTINGYAKIEDAEVYTNPPTKQGITDEFGSVLLTDLEIGSYEVFATKEGIGSGKSVVNIMENDLAQTNVNILQGVNVDFPPSINVILPAQPAEFSEGEEITFSVDVEDDETAKQDLKVTWESDLDGLLHNVKAGIDGNATFSTKSLIRGIHQITITVEDSDGYTSIATITINTQAPSSINLLEPTKEAGKVNLVWTEYTNDDFLMYEIYRTMGECTNQGQTLLTTINDKSVTTFIDENPPFEFRVCYFVRVTNIDNNSRNSNEETVDSPSGHIFNFVPTNFLKHPSEEFVYLVDRAAQKLIKFNYNNLEVTNEINLKGTIGHCDIGDNGFGVEIYTPSNDGWIYVYDADNLNQTTSINTGLSNNSVVINGLGQIIVSMYPSPWWEQPVRTYSRDNGINLDGNGDNEGDVLRMIPGKNEIISITTSVSPIDMEYFKLSNDGLFEIHQNDQYHGDHPLDPNIFRISPSGSYSITSRLGAVYLANSSMEYKGQLQRGSLYFSDYAFSDDGSIIYAATSNRKSIQIGNYPSLVRDAEILTKGFPIFIIKDGEKIISLSKSTEYSNNTGIEIINL